MFGSKLCFCFNVLVGDENDIAISEKVVLILSSLPSYRYRVEYVLDDFGKLFCLWCSCIIRVTWESYGRWHLFRWHKIFMIMLRWRSPSKPVYYCLPYNLKILGRESENSAQNTAWEAIKQCLRMSWLNIAQYFLVCG